MARPVAEARQIAERAIQQARRHISVARAYLYGSYAKGMAHEHSDIDLGIFTPDRENMSLDEYFDICQAISKSTDYEVQVHLFSMEKLDEARPTNFAGHIIETGERLA